VVNEQRVRAVVAGSGEPIVVLDNERRIVAVSEAAARTLDDASPGRRLSEEQAAAHPNLLVLFLESPPELPAYQELRAGFTAAVSHELRTPLARLLVLLESATLPGSAPMSVVIRARASSSAANCSSCESRCGAARLREYSCWARSVRSGIGPVLAAFR